MNAHINGLLRQHEQDYSDIKKYFRDITKDNIQLIKNQKVEITKLKDSIAKARMELAQLTQEMDKDDDDKESKEIITEEEVTQKRNELKQIKKNHKTAEILMKNLEKRKEELSNELENIKDEIDEKLKERDD